MSMMELMSTQSVGSVCSFGESAPSFLSDMLGDGWVETMGSDLGAEAAEESKDLLAGDTKNSVSFQGTLEGRPVKQTKAYGSNASASATGAEKWKITVRVEQITSLATGVYEETQVVPGGLDMSARDAANAHPDALAVQRALHLLSGNADEYLTALHERVPSLASKQKGVPRVAIEELRDLPLPTKFLELIPAHRRPEFEGFRMCQVPTFKIPDAEARKKFQEKHRKPMGGVPPFLNEAALIDSVRETFAASSDAVTMLHRVLSLVNCELQTFSRGKLVSFNTSDNISCDRLKVMANGVISVVVLQLCPGTRELVKPLRYYQCKKGVKSIGPRLDDGSRLLHDIEAGRYTDLHPRGSFMQAHRIAVGATSEVVDVDDPERALRGPVPTAGDKPSRTQEKLMLPICSVKDLMIWMTRKRGSAATLGVDRPLLQEGSSGGTEAEKEAESKYNSMLMFWKKKESRDSVRLALPAPAFAWSSPVLTESIDEQTGRKYLIIDVSTLAMYKIKVALYGEEIARLGIPESACTTWAAVAPKIVSNITGIYEAVVDTRASNTMSEATLKRATISEDEGGIRKEFDDVYSAYRLPNTAYTYKFWIPGPKDDSQEASKARETMREATGHLLKLKPSCAIATYSGTMLWEPKEIIAASGIQIPRAAALYILEKQRQTAKLSQGLAANAVSELRNLSVVLSEGETMASRVASIPDNNDWIFYYVGPLATQFSNSIHPDDKRSQVLVESGQAGTTDQYGAIFSANYDKARRAEYDTYMQSHGMSVGNTLYDARIQTSDMKGIVYAITRPLDRKIKRQRVNEALADRVQLPAIHAAAAAPSRPSLPAGAPTVVEHDDDSDDHNASSRPKRKSDDTRVTSDESHKIPKIGDVDDFNSHNGNAAHGFDDIVDF